MSLAIDDQTIAAAWEDDRIIDGASWEDSRTFPLPNIAMTKTGVKINPVVIGDDFRIKRTYTTLPAGVVITKAWLTIKASDSQLDAAALMQLDITVTLTANGQITDADTAGGSIGMFFDLPRAKTALAAPNLGYAYDVQVKASDGLIHTMELGTISFTRGRTDAIA